MFDQCDGCLYRSRIVAYGFITTLKQSMCLHNVVMFARHCPSPVNMTWCPELPKSIWESFIAEIEIAKGEWSVCGV